MPTIPQRHKRPILHLLKPRLPELQPRIKLLDTKTLKQRQRATGRTLALNGETWRRLRAQVLAEQPLCPDCKDQGLIVPAVDVDHIDNNSSNNRRDNLVGLCHSHHSQKTARDKGYKARHGCDATGRPLDPSHHWNDAQKAGKSPATGQAESTGSLRAHRRS